MAQNVLAANGSGDQHRLGAGDASGRAGSRVKDGVHYVPKDGGRFPACGGWRSNWNHTGDPQQATCPECRARLAATPTAPGPSGER